MAQVNAYSILKNIDHEIKKLEKYALAFPDIFKQEEQAVILHDIESLENVGAKKHELLSGLQDSLENMVSLCSQLSDPKKLTLKSFSEIREYLESYLKDSNYKNRLHIETTKKLIESIDNLIDLYADIKPKIEKNRFVIARLLHHHQESYRFWSELNKENSSNYDSKGTRKNQSTISQLFAKA